MVRVLKTIGFDRGYQRGSGQYLFDRSGRRYLDLLSGWGVFAIGRNHPAVRDTLKNVLDGDFPNLVQMDVSGSGRLVGRALVALHALPRQGVLCQFRKRDCRGGAEICPCRDRPHGNRLLQPRFSRIVLWLTLGEWRCDFPCRLRSAAARVHRDPVRRSRCARKGVGRAQNCSLHRRAHPRQRRHRSRRRTIFAARSSCAAHTAPCSLPTKFRRDSVEPADFLPSSTGASSPTWCSWPSRCRAGMCRWGRC